MANTFVLLCVLCGCLARRDSPTNYSTFDTALGCMALFPIPFASRRTLWFRDKFNGLVHPFTATTHTVISCGFFGNKWTIHRPLWLEAIAHFSSETQGKSAKCFVRVRREADICNYIIPFEQTACDEPSLSAQPQCPNTRLCVRVVDHHSLHQLYSNSSRWLQVLVRNAWLTIFTCPSS